MEIPRNSLLEKDDYWPQFEALGADGFEADQMFGDDDASVIQLSGYLIRLEADHFQVEVLSCSRGFQVLKKAPTANKVSEAQNGSRDNIKFKLAG